MTATARAFVDLLLSQDGDRYVWGAEARPSDTNPDAFDCSELVQWGLGRLGVAAPDGSWLQARWVSRNGLTVPVAEAIDTPGALLFRFSSDPMTTTPSSRHVAVSQGDGMTIEARSTRLGVGQFSADGRAWTLAGLVPGLTYGGTVTTEHIEADQVTAETVEAGHVVETGAQPGPDEYAAAAREWMAANRLSTADTNPDDVPNTDQLATFLYRYHHRVVVPAIAAAIKQAAAGGADNYARQLAKRAVDALHAIGEEAGGA